MYATKLESRFFIMHLWQTGNIGSHNIAKAECNPEEGFLTAYDAKKHMIEETQKEQEQGNSRGWWELKQPGYIFTIMEIFTVIKS